MTRRSGSGNGSGRSSTPSTMEKIAVVAPLPSASIRMAVTVNPGDLRSWRKGYRACQGLRHILQDTRYTFRQLRKSPGFTVTAILMLALGMREVAAASSIDSGVLR